jgi:hypothetical protein
MFGARLARQAAIANQNALVLDRGNPADRRRFPAT